MKVKSLLASSVLSLAFVLSLCTVPAAAATTPTFTVVGQIAGDTQEIPAITAHAFKGDTFDVSKLPFALTNVKYYIVSAHKQSNGKYLYSYGVTTNGAKK